ILSRGVGGGRRRDAGAAAAASISCRLGSRTYVLVVVAAAQFGGVRVPCLDWCDPISERRRGAAPQNTSARAWCLL
ncbi:hypothetical protein ACJX0J_029771, partial [Zea mays]